MVSAFEPYCGDFEPSPVAETMLRVSVHTLLRAYRAQKIELTWFDKQGKWVGVGKITKLEADLFRIDYVSNKIHFVKHCRSALEMKIGKVNHGGYERPSFLCGSCGGFADRLLKLEYRWACRKCHGAINISTRLTKSQRLYAEYLDLLAEVKEQPAPRQHWSTFEKQYARLKLLESYWAVRPKTELPAIWYKQIHERFYLLEESPELGASER